MRDGLGRPASVLVLGGGSDIAQATVRRLVREGTRRVLLAGRKPERFQTFGAELEAAGAEVGLLELDLDELTTHEPFVERAFAGDDVDIVILAAGVLGDQALAERDAGEAVAIFRTNVVGPVSLLTPIVRRLVQQGHGTIVVLSSIAAERSRRANYVYGSSKAGLDAFARGLGDRFAAEGVRVIVVRPGFVATKMTSGRRPAPFATSPEAVGAAIVDGIRADRSTVWVPPVLRWVGVALRHLPRPVFLAVTARERP